MSGEIGGWDLGQTVNVSTFEWSLCVLLVYMFTLGKPLLVP